MAAKSAPRPAQSKKFTSSPMPLSSDKIPDGESIKLQRKMEFLWYEQHALFDVPARNETESLRPAHIDGIRI
jgi:hypothetical protein